MKDPTAPAIRPIEPRPVTLNAEKSALLVVELSEYVGDPDYFAAPLAPGVRKLLARARAAGVVIAFTVPHPFKGKPQGQVYSGFERKPHEPVFFPPGFDKFSSGELRSLLSLYDIDTLVMTGCKANMAILYTATRAVSEYRYQVVIPVDGIAATTEYEKDYTLYQFRAYPDGSPQRFTYTTLAGISFQ